MVGLRRNLSGTATVEHTSRGRWAFLARLREALNPRAGRVAVTPSIRINVAMPEFRAPSVVETWNARAKQLWRHIAGPEVVRPTPHPFWAERTITDPQAIAITRQPAEIASGLYLVTLLRYEPEVFIRHDPWVAHLYLFDRQHNRAAELIRPHGQSEPSADVMPTRFCYDLAQALDRNHLVRELYPFDSTLPRVETEPIPMPILQIEEIAQADAGELRHKMNVIASATRTARLAASGAFDVIYAHEREKRTGSK